MAKFKDRQFKKRKFNSKTSRRRGDRLGKQKAICARCKKQCEVPFKPTGSKPVYCSKCFGKSSETHQLEALQEEIDLLHFKIDKVLNALEIE